jgi:anti-sigma factor RsiW
MIDPPRVSDEDLHALIDGELDPARTAEVTAQIEVDAELARKVVAFRADKARLAQLYAPLLDSAVPREWLEMIARPRQRPHIVALRRTVFALAASLVLMFAGWTAYQRVAPQEGEALIAEALAVHGGATAVVPVDAARIMTAALGLPLQAPDLSKMGFALAGVEVIEPSRGTKAVKLAYRDANDRRFTVYLKPSSGTPRFDMLKRGAVRICVWQDDVLGTIMLGEMSAAEMLRLASLAYSGLSA